MSEQELIQAVENSDYDKIIELINRGVNLDIKFPQKNRENNYMYYNNQILTETPLGHAVENFDTKMVKILVEGGADVNYTDPIRRAIYRSINDKNYFPGVKFSEDEDDFYFDYDDDEGKEEKDEIFKYLLDHGVDVNSKDIYGAQTILGHCAYEGMIHFMKLALEKGADINLGEIFNVTPLMLASQNGMLTSIIFLLNNGAKVNVKDYDGNTELMHLVQDIDENDPDDETIERYIKCIYLLAKNGADTEIKNKEGKTVFNLVSNRKIKAALKKAKRIFESEFSPQIKSKVNGCKNQEDFYEQKEFNKMDRVVTIKLKDEKNQTYISCFSCDDLKNFPPITDPNRYKTIKTWYRFLPSELTDVHINSLYDFVKKNKNLICL
jgi:ankyrin repeat protein